MKELKKESFGMLQNAEETDRQQCGDVLIERKNVQNTPFTLVKDDKGWFVTMGEYRLSDIFETEEEAEKKAEVNWETLIPVIAIIVEKIIKK